MTPLFAFLSALGAISFPNVAHARLMTFGIIGDAGHPTPDHFRVQRSLEKSQVSQLILPGDNLYDLRKTYQDVWGPWRDRGFNFPVVALGNHTRGYEEEWRFFRLPGEFYSRADSDLRFIVVNSDNQEMIEPQLRFLDQELSTARERFVFIVMHHPPFTVSERHDWRERKLFQQGFRRLLRKHAGRITALIVGHDHIASLIDVSGVPMIVSGAVMEQIPTRPRDYAEDGFQVRTLWLFKRGPHWVRLDADAARAHVWLNFIDVAHGSVACSARIYPRPVLKRDNCAASQNRASPVKTATDPRGRPRTPDMRH